MERDSVSIKVPADLETAANVQSGAQLYSENHPNQMFWVIKNGAKMTGMAAFGKSPTDQQMWDLAAFLQKDRGVSAADYAKAAK
jgi:hypothetical protein